MTNRPIVWFLHLLIIGSLAAIQQGCSPENDPTPASKATILSRVWEIQAASSAYDRISYRFYEKGRSDNDTDMSAYRFIFRANGAFSLENHADTIEGTWKLVDQDTRLVLNETTYWTVHSLTEAQFVFSFRSQDTDPAGQSIDVETTYQLTPLP